MKFSFIIAFSLLLGSMSLNAQQKLKFGHIDSDALFSAMPELADVEKQMDAEYKKYESQLTTMQEQLKTDQQKYMAEAKTLTAEVRSEREKTLMEMNQRIQTYYSQAQKQLQSKEQELKTPLIQKVEAAIKAVGEENGFLYVFEEKAGVAVYHSEKSEDIAPLVKLKLGIK